MNAPPSMTHLAIRQASSTPTPTAPSAQRGEVSSTDRHKAALLVTHSTELTATLAALAQPGQPLMVITPDQLPNTPWQRCPLILIDADTAPETPP